MLSKNVCNKCRKEVWKAVAQPIGDNDWWECPFSKGVGHACYAVSIKETKIPPSYCPKKFEHAIAETSKC